jgi:hypothetical protein
MAAAVQILVETELLEQVVVALSKAALVLQIVAVAVVVLMLLLLVQVVQELLFLNTQILLQFHNQA